MWLLISDLDLKSCLKVTSNFVGWNQRSHIFKFLYIPFLQTYVANSSCIVDGFRSRSESNDFFLGSGLRLVDVGSWLKRCADEQSFEVARYSCILMVHVSVKFILVYVCVCTDIWLCDWEDDAPECNILITSLFTSGLPYRAVEQDIRDFFRYPHHPYFFVCILCVTLWHSATSWLLMTLLTGADCIIQLRMCRFCRCVCVWACVCVFVCVPDTSSMRHAWIIRMCDITHYYIRQVSFPKGVLDWNTPLWCTCECVVYLLVWVCAHLSVLFD